jgi:hypothetical protein
MGLKEKEDKKIIHTRYGRPSKPPERWTYNYMEDVGKRGNK